MFNLQKRKFLNITNGTNEYIGPGTYIIEKFVENVKSSKPFLCSTKRTIVDKNPIWTEAVYFPKLSDKIKGGISPSNRASRFNYDLDQTPGPTDFDTKECDNYSESDKEQLKHRGRLYSGRVPFSLEVTGLSVPTKCDANGYEIDKDGRLVKNPPTDYDTTLGPAFYCTPCPLNATEQLYRGCCWSKSTTKRAKILSSCMPGPDTYTPKLISKLCKWRYPYYEIQQKNTRCVRKPRYMDQIMIKAKEENFPAPCDYSPIKFQRKKQIKAPFSQTAKRETMKSTSDSPSPDKYNICDCICPKKMKSTKPFLISAHRFKPLQRSNVGPCTYTPKDTFNDQLTRNVNKTKFVRAGFLSSTVRTSPFIDPNAEECVPPNRYCLARKNICSSHLKKMENSQFKSKTKRFKKLEKSDTLSGCCNYQVESAYRLIHDRISHRKIVTSKKIKDGFLSSTPDRFQPYFDFCTPFKNIKTPGPAYYSIPNDSLRKGSTFSRGATFQVLDESRRLPGPNTYKIHDSLTNSMFKTKFTFNTRLAKSVEKKSHKKDRIFKEK